MSQWKGTGLVQGSNFILREGRDLKYADSMDQQTHVTNRLRKRLKGCYSFMRRIYFVKETYSRGEPSKLPCVVKKLRSARLVDCAWRLIKEWRSWEWNKRVYKSGWKLWSRNTHLSKGNKVRGVDWSGKKRKLLRVELPGVYIWNRHRHPVVDNRTRISLRTDPNAIVTSFSICTQYSALRLSSLT